MTDPNSANGEIRMAFDLDTRRNTWTLTLHGDVEDLPQLESEILQEAPSEALVAEIDRYMTELRSRLSDSEDQEPV